MRKKLLPLFALVGILLLAFFLRWWHIESVAPGISLDEVGYALSAKSFFLTGTGLDNFTRPLDVLLFKYPTTDAIQAELPYLILLPFVGPFAFSLALIRLPFVLMSVGIVALLYAIGKELFDKKTGLFAALLGAINPYLVVIGRTSYEVVPSMFFFLLSFWMILRLRGYKILFSFPVLLCAFYAYIATKVLFVPFIFLLSFFGYFYVQKRKDAVYYLLLSILGILSVLAYLLLTHVHSSGARMSEIFTPNSPQVSYLVDHIRASSMNSFLNTLVVNKFTIYLKILVQNFFAVFSANTLFSTGDGFFRLYDHGLLYYLDGVFILAGLIVLFTRKKLLGLFLMLFAVVSTLPQVIYSPDGNTIPLTTNYSHSTVVFPFLVILASFGVTGILELVSRKYVRWSLLALITAGYLLSFLFFFQSYFYSYSLAGRDNFSTRLMARYVSLEATSGQNVEVLSSVSTNHFRKYLFYANALNPSTIGQIKQTFITHKLNVGRVTFGSCLDPKMTKTLPKNVVIVEDAICGNPDFAPLKIIPLIADGGIGYKIYNDTVCTTEPLHAYPQNLTLSDLNVEKLSTSDFCTTFINQR